MVARLALVLSGVAVLGLGGLKLADYLSDPQSSQGFVPWGLVLTITGMVLGLTAILYVTRQALKSLRQKIEELPAQLLIAGAIGLAAGLFIAILLSLPFSRLPGWPGIAVPIALSLSLGYLGIFVALLRVEDLARLFPGSRPTNEANITRQDGQIILDTSAIIDGRIADISQTGFVNSTLIIPRFVLNELQHVADSSDALRRNRGRRGLDMLNRLQKESLAHIKVLDVDVKDGSNEVDAKLVQLAKKLGASIATTDFNLNKVAEIQGVRVLNINELANSLKPVVLPGEEIVVQVIQAGKEAGQGVAFLDDGTMVVVEGGRRYISTHLDVVITRVLQTPAGRIIFAQPKGS
ncbi:MAG: PIN domain nuclease [Chloroflexi bacterium]|nr:PIN domain nuclease [Chloroflexota bacterium]